MAQDFGKDFTFQSSSLDSVSRKQANTVDSAKKAELVLVSFYENTHKI